MKNRLLKGAVLLASVFALTGCDATDQLSEDLQALPGNIFGNPIALAIQLVATLILILIVGKFLFKPVRKIINQRKEYVVQQISAADEIKKRAEEKEAAANAQIASLNDQAKTILVEAKKNADDLKEKANEEIEAERKAQKELLAKQIEQEKEKAREEVRKEIVSVALDASSAILEREVNESDNKKIIEDFIKEVGTDE